MREVTGKTVGMQDRNHKVRAPAGPSPGKAHVRERPRDERKRGFLAASRSARRVKLAATHQRIAIPEPWSGYIEIEGHETSDGVVAVSLLNGAEPLAIPCMRLGEKIKLALDDLRH